VSSHLPEKHGYLRLVNVNGGTTGNRGRGRSGKLSIFIYREIYLCSNRKCLTVTPPDS
jgi:hypothetical protein